MFRFREKGVTAVLWTNMEQNERSFSGESTFEEEEDIDDDSSE